MNGQTLYLKAKSRLDGDHAAKAASSRRFLSLLAVATLAASAMAPELALAAPWDSAGQGILEILTGGLTRTIAIIAVIACGLAALAGKLSWDWAIKIVVGIVLIFGAATIVDYIISATGT